MTLAWQVGIIGFALGVGCGFGIAYLMRGNRRRVEELEQELDTLRQRFDGYREQVNRHFLTTSELVQKMTDSYRDVYEHLAQGSEQLCRNPLDTPSLDFTQQPVLEKPDEVPQPLGAADADEAPQPDKDSTKEFSDAETDTGGDNDDYLGDAPNVPSLETEEPVNRRTL